MLLESTILYCSHPAPSPPPYSKLEADPGGINPKVEGRIIAMVVTASDHPDSR